MTDLLHTPLTEIVDLLGSRKLSPVELMQTTLARIEETQPKLNAFTAMRDAEAVLADAKAAGDRVRKEIEEKARVEAQGIGERARHEIERERDAESAVSRHYG